MSSEGVTVTGAEDDPDEQPKCVVVTDPTDTWTYEQMNEHMKLWGSLLELTKREEGGSWLARYKFPYQANSACKMGGCSAGSVPGKNLKATNVFLHLKLMEQAQTGDAPAEQAPAASEPKPSKPSSSGGASLESQIGEAAEETWRDAVREQASVCDDVDPEFNIMYISFETQNRPTVFAPAQAIPLCERACAAAMKLINVGAKKKKDIDFASYLWETLGLGKVSAKPLKQFGEDEVAYLCHQSTTAQESFLASGQWVGRTKIPFDFQKRYKVHEVDGRLKKPLRVPPYYWVNSSGTLFGEKQDHLEEQDYSYGLLEFCVKNGSDDSDRKGIEDKVYQMFKNLLANKKWFDDNKLRMQGTVVFNGDEAPHASIGALMGWGLPDKRKEDLLLDEAVITVTKHGGAIHFKWHKSKQKPFEIYKERERLKEEKKQLEEEKEKAEKAAVEAKEMAEKAAAEAKEKAEKAAAEAKEMAEKAAAEAKEMAEKAAAEAKEKAEKTAAEHAKDLEELAVLRAMMAQQMAQQGKMDS